MNRLPSLLITCLAIVGFAGKAQAHRGPKPPKPSHVRIINPQNLETVESLYKATSERAEKDIHVQLAKKVSQWLAVDGVPLSWTPPQKMVDDMITGSVDLEPVKVQNYDLFKATCQANFATEVRAEFLEKYHRFSAGKLLATLGGILAVVLTCLASLTGYIRADEATKGYYTNQLRLVAAAGVGAAGVLAYRFLA